MNNKIINTLAFAVGAGIGYFTAMKILKDKYAKYAQEEIDSVREVYEKKTKSMESKIEFSIPIGEKGTSDMDILKAEINNLKYSSNDNKKGDQMNNRIHVIPPECFGESDNSTESLTYYSDGILTYDNDEVIENIDDIVGSDSLNHFGEYEDDSVFVRNDDLDIDFEILRDNRRYSDVVNND